MRSGNSGFRFLFFELDIPFNRDHEGTGPIGVVVPPRGIFQDGVSEIFRRFSIIFVKEINLSPVDEARQIVRIVPHGLGVLKDGLDEFFDLLVNAS